MCKLGYKHTEETKQKLREARAKQSNPRPKGFIVSEETKLKMRLNHADFSGEKHPLYGKPVSQETRERIRKANKGQFTGEKNPSWKGGVTRKNVIIRNSGEYKQWRTAIFEKDGYACVECGVSGSEAHLQADHIKPFAYYPELRFDLDNGRTLCVPCHKLTGTWGHKMSMVSHHA